jgi:hypothetical protein
MSGCTQSETIGVVAGASTNVGTYTVVAPLISSDPNYANAKSAPGAFTISR